MLENKENLIEESKKIYSDKFKSIKADSSKVRSLIQEEYENTDFFGPLMAWSYIEEIESFDIKNLILQLPQFDTLERCTLISAIECIGFILQKYYKVDLEDLFIESYKANKLKKIIVFIDENLQSNSKIKEKNFEEILKILKEGNDYFIYKIFKEYCDCISKRNPYKFLKTKLDDLTEEKVGFLESFRWSCFYHNYDDAIKILKHLSTFKDEKHMIATLKFIEVSLKYNVDVIKEYIPWMKENAATYENAKEELIKISIAYINAAKTEVKIVNGFITYLDTVSSMGTEKEKLALIDAISKSQDICIPLRDIFHKAIKCNFENQELLLDSVSYYFYMIKDTNDCKEEIDILSDLYRYNFYTKDRYNLFNDAHMSSVSQKLCKYKEYSIHKAVEYCLSTDIVKIYFGLCLLKKMLFPMSCEDSSVLDSFKIDLNLKENELLKIAKEVLFLGIGGKMICYIIFWLCKQNSCGDVYLDFCNNEVYSDYPFTFYNISIKYLDSSFVQQSQLANKIKERHEKYLEYLKNISRIIDLSQSHDNYETFSKIMATEQRHFNDEIMKHSIFAQLTNTVTLKYGRRIATIIDKKDERTLNIREYMERMYEDEFPKTCLEDPVGYIRRKQSFIEECKKNETNN